MFPITIFIGYVIIGVTFNNLHHHLNYKILRNVGLIMLNSTIVLLLIISILYKNKQSTGYNISLFLTVMGIASNIAQLSFLGIINYLSGEVVSIYNLGISTGGLLMVILRILILATKGS
jgi:hypothetical protein